MNELPDPLQELLKPIAQEEPAELRARLRKQTSRSVRVRAAMRWSGIAAIGVAACLAIVLLVSQLEKAVRQSKLKAAPTPVAQQQQQPVEPVAADMGPLDLEWQAFDSQTNRAEAYFLAGNKYLEANNDLESALRCYRQALDACTELQLEITADDNWLVASLKNARRKENVHE
jgi:hypothetical protein